MSADSCQHPLAEEFEYEVSSTDETELAREQPRSELREMGTATIYPLSGDMQLPLRCPVLTRDLSAAGFGIVLTRQLQPKQRIELEVQSQLFVGEIVWCRGAEFGFYIAGCRKTTSDGQ